MDIKKTFVVLLASSLLISCSQTTNNAQKSDVNIFANPNANLTIQKPVTIDMTSPNQNERPDGASISAIILHHTASAADAKATGNFFADPKAQVSSHYIVDRSGYLVQPVVDSARAWHAGKSIFNGVSNVNDFSIGIEICNVGDSVEPYPDAQYNAVINLVSYLVKTYNIPVANITRHRDIAIPPGRKTDTSDNFSVQRVLDGVKSSLAGNFIPVKSNNIKQFSIPETREVITQKDEKTLTIIADKYLDNENRVNELKILNPQIKNENLVPINTKIIIPTTFKYHNSIK
ncbi:MAG: N-acetylmuramoyl-L-alanine amidase [Candidatus Sericytochromatia bacterium]|nr:N-acetylmuramoyl-L-alanine amidase [Candidatus Sericytochromatia bacterium]